MKYKQTRDEQKVISQDTSDSESSNILQKIVKLPSKDHVELLLQDLMVDECINLKMVEVIHFDTSNVTNMYEMFYGCSSLSKLSLSNFDARNVTEMTDMLNLNVGAGYSADNFELSLGKYFFRPLVIPSWMVLGI